MTVEDPTLGGLLGPLPKRTTPSADDLVQCQGCGAVRGGAWLGKAHACWRNEDGSYEEGGTFQ